MDIAKWEKLVGVTTVIRKGIGKMNALNVRVTYKRVAEEDSGVYRAGKSARQSSGLDN